MKIAVNRSAAAASSAPIEAGRHVGCITQLVSLGLLKAFEEGKDPVAHFGIAFEMPNGATVARTVTASTSVSSFLGIILDVAGLAVEGQDGEVEISDLLGKHVAINVELRDGRFPKLTGFEQLMDWDERHTPKATPFFFDINSPPKQEANKLFQMIHADIRHALNRRVKGGAT